MLMESDGILVVDKPLGISSAGVVGQIKRITGARKVGHTGTLDPFATGVLVCCLNKATRLSRFFLKATKKYEAVLQLGIETDTQDATGEIVTEIDSSQLCADPGLHRHAIERAAKRFEGRIEQVPPAFSALKHKGVPLYRLARKGTPVTKPARSVFVSSLEIRDVSLPDIRLSVSCSSGTYIRTLCTDIGRELGCGGHLKTLRRTESCGFSISEASSIASVQLAADRETLAELLIPMVDALRGMPEIIVDEDLARRVDDGIVLSVDELSVLPETLATGSLTKVVDKDRRLLAVVEPDINGNWYNYCCVFPKYKG